MPALFRSQERCAPFGLFVGQGREGSALPALKNGGTVRRAFTCGQAEGLRRAPLALALRRRSVRGTRWCFLLAFDFSYCNMEGQEDLRAKPFLYL